MRYEPKSVLRDRIGANVGIRGNSSYNTLIDEWIDEAYDDCWVFFLWPQFLHRGTSSVAAAVDTMTFPANVAEVVALYNNRVPMWSDFEASALFVRRFLNALEDTSAGGVSSWHTDDGEVPVTTQPSAATVLKVVSDSTSDITQKVRIWGLNANGIEIGERLNLNGTTEVTGTVSFLTVIKVQKDATTAGIVSLINSSTTISRIAAHEYQARHRRVRLSVRADVATTWYWLAKRRPIPLVNADDGPEFDCGKAIVHLATARAQREQGQHAKAQEEAGSGAAALTLLRNQILGQGDRVMRMVPHFRTQTPITRRYSIGGRTF